MHSKVSVVVLNYNGAHLLADCLQSLIAQDYGSMQTIVVDNASTDRSREVVARYEGIRLLALSENRGLSRALNEGARASTGTYLFLVNNDMRFPPDLLSRLTGEAARWPDLFALDIKQLDWAGDHIVHGAIALRRGPFRSRFLPFVELDQTLPEEAVEVPWASGANLFCVRERFMELGGFDELFFADWEDVDLCWRAWLRGWSSVFLPSAFCWHRVGATFGSPQARRLTPDQLRRLRGGTENRMRFALKTMTARLCLQLLVANQLVAAGQLMRGRPHEGAAVLAGSWAWASQWREIARLRREIAGQTGAKSGALLERFLHGPARPPLRTEGR